MSTRRPAIKLKSKAAQNVLASMTKGGEPEVTSDRYNHTLLKYLNYHNSHTDLSDMRKWVVKYMTDEKRKKELTIIKRASDFELRSLGMLCRILTKGWYLSNDDVARVEKTIKDLVTKYKPIKTAAAEKAGPVLSIAERMQQIASTHIAEFEGRIDIFLTEGDEFSAKDYIAEKELKGKIVNLIGKWFEKLQVELHEAVEGNDKQLKEGYSNLSRMKLRRFSKFIDQIVTDCNGVTKVSRKPRVKKSKPASKLVEKVQYLTEFEGRKSESPEKIIGANEVWIYDTKMKQMMVYRPEPMSTLTVSRTTIKGFDAVKSEKKRTSDIKNLFSGKLTSRNMASKFKALKSKASAPSGRINANMIIVKVF